MRGMNNEQAPQPSTRWRVGRALCVVAPVTYGLLTGAIDVLDPHHLGNPDWPGHARLHFMWAISFMFCSGLANLYYLWLRPLGLGALRLCWVWQATSLLGGFWTAVVLADLYGGTIRDPEHHATILGVNENVLVFGALAVLLVGVAPLLRPRVDAAV